jgi:hypothetical protein
MEKRHRSFPERTYKANIMPGGITYKISPMTMIIDQMRRDSLAAGADEDNINRNEENDREDE